LSIVALYSFASSIRVKVKVRIRASRVPECAFALEKSDDGKKEACEKRREDLGEAAVAVVVVCVGKFISLCRIAVQYCTLS